MTDDYAYFENQGSDYVHEDSEDFCGSSVDFEDGEGEDISDYGKNSYDEIWFRSR